MEYYLSIIINKVTTIRYWDISKKNEQQNPVTKKNPLMKSSDQQRVKYMTIIVNPSRQKDRCNHQNFTEIYD